MVQGLRVNPYVKTYDELKRSITRMEQYQELSGHLLTVDEKFNLGMLIGHMKEAIKYIPEDFKVTRYKYTKKEE